MSSEVYLQPCQKSMMEHFAKVVTGYKLLTTFAKHSVVDFLHGSEYPLCPGTLHIVKC